MNHRKTRSVRMMKATSGIPLVQKMYDLIKADPRIQSDIAEEVGLNKSTISGWTRREPRLLSFEAMLNSMGYRLEIVPIEKEATE